MDNLCNDLINASRSGNFLHIVYEKSLGEPENRNALEETLIRIHNNELVDVIAYFSLLENKPNSGYDFLCLCHVLEKILPRLNASVKSIMECVLHSVCEMGQDMAAGSIFEPFIDFCAAQPSRPKEALLQIEKNIEQLVDILAPTIVAGARIDLKYYLNEAIRLSSHENVEIRKRAVFSLGRIQYSQDLKLCSSAISCFELCATKENDDHILGNLINSAFRIFKLDRSQEDRIINIINLALSRGDDCSMHEASKLLGFNFNELPETLLDSLLDQLRVVKPQNRGTLKNIGYGLIEIMNKEDPNKGIEFFESILTANSDEISIDSFDNVIFGIGENEKVLNKLATRWFLKGDSTLCKFIYEVVRKRHDHNLLLKVDPSELVSKDQLYIYFIARKAIGYLFLYPVTAASMIISLMHNTNEDETLNLLGQLLFDPLLLNFPGKVEDYLIQQSETERGKIQATIKMALESFNKYISELKSTGVIHELHPPQTQRDAYRRHFSLLMAQSLKQAEKESVFLPFFSKSVLLYGKKSISYVYGPDGKSDRMEIPLQSHGTEMEVPRFQIIDSFGLDYMIRVFRTEQKKS